MSLPFGPLFMICLLFADLTDDVIALLDPAMPVQPPSTVLEQTVLLSRPNTATSAMESIRPPLPTWKLHPPLEVIPSLSSPEEVRGPRFRDFVPRRSASTS